RKESQDFVGAIDGLERGGTFTAAIRIQDRISGQYLHERLSVPRRDSLVKGDRQTAGFVGRSGKPRSAGSDVLARTRRKLATGCLPGAEGGADLGKIETEYVVKEEPSPLRGRRAFEKEHHRDENIVSKVPRRFVLKCFIHHRFRQPLAHIDFTARTR